MYFIVPIYIPHHTTPIIILTPSLTPYMYRGYIAVVNRSQKDIQDGLPIRQGLTKELAFFQSHNKYRQCISKCGTVNLSRALNQILMHHIRDCLPDIKSKITSQYLTYQFTIVQFSVDVYIYVVMRMIFSLQYDVYTLSWHCVWSCVHTNNIHYIFTIYSCTIPCSYTPIYTYTEMMVGVAASLEALGDAGDGLLALGPTLLKIISKFATNVATRCVQYSVSMVYRVCVVYSCSIWKVYIQCLAYNLQTIV